MAYTSFSDIYDPIKISKIVGDSWILDTAILKSGIAKRDASANGGSLSYTLRDRKFQDVSGQNVKAGGTISTVGNSQIKVTHPIIFKDAGMEESDVLEMIKEKSAPSVNADMATSIKNAASQFLDSSMISCIEGVAAALTDNKTGSGAIVDGAGLLAAKGILGERGLMLNGGGMLMRSDMYFKLGALGLVAMTANTFGNNFQNQVVLQGQLPTNVLGLTPIISDKCTDLGSNKDYIYLIGSEAMTIKGNEAPTIESAKLTAVKKRGTVTLFGVSYGIGFDGVTWGLAGKEDVSDVELATSGNWSLSYSSSNQVVLARFYTATA